MIDNEDVARFLDEHLDHLERFDASDDHPFRNIWHGGSWAEEAREVFAEVRDEFPAVEPEEVEAFLARVGALARRRGYADGAADDAGA
jgi:hypothetical protein